MVKQINLNAINLIIFDLDDTLVKLSIDYAKLRKKLSNFVKKQYGIRNEFKPLLGSINNVAILTNKKGISKEKSKRDMFNIVKNAELDGAKKSSLMPYAKETIQFFKRKGMKIAIVSRNSNKAVKIALQKHKLPYNLIIGFENTKRTKPFPDAIRLAIRKLHAKPKNSLIIGDHPYDIIAGKKAKTAIIGIASGKYTTKDLKKAGADYTFISLNKMRGLLGKR